MIIVENLVKIYGKHRVLDGVSLQQKKGEVIVLIGPSGCGKTTLLRCLNQIDTFDSGRICVAGTEISASPGKKPRIDHKKQRSLRMKVGMVFQSFNLFPHMTTLENVIEAPVTVKGLDRRQAVEQALSMLEKVGLEHKVDFYPSQLSGGQQQRVAIARALAMEPEIMLFDEPTSALDPELKEEVLAVIRRLAGEGMTMLMVTHEMEFAKDMADHVIFLESGRIVEMGPADMMCSNPQHDRTREFLKRILSGKPRPLKKRPDRHDHPGQTIMPF